MALRLAVADHHDDGERAEPTAEHRGHQHAPPPRGEAPRRVSDGEAGRGDGRHRLEEERVLRDAATPLGHEQEPHDVRF